MLKWSFFLQSLRYINGMTKKLNIDCELDYFALGPANYLFNLQLAKHPWQTILHESFSVSPHSQVTHGLHNLYENRLAKVNSDALNLYVSYQAVVEVDYPSPVGDEKEMSINDIPIEVMPYLWPSQYCESNEIIGFAERTFGYLPSGYPRVQAICDWISQHVIYQPGHTNTTSSCLSVLVNRIGVCRDFAHLGITFCRALNIPARFVTGYTWYQSAPNDFHAIFEAYLGNRWILFDPTNLCLLTDFARIGTGRDAADCAFSTLFGHVEMTRINPIVNVEY